MSWIPSYKKKYDVPYVPPEWSSGSDEEIVEALEKHYAGEIDLTEYWSVGDERVIQLSAMGTTYVGERHNTQNRVFVLTEVGGKYLSDGVTECAFQIDQKTALTNRGYMHSYGMNTWSSCARRNWCNETYYNAIPQSIRPIFKQFINQTGLGGYQTTTGNTTDYFAMRAEIEVSGTTNYSVSGEGTQVEYYKTSANRQKNKNYAWWLRSPQPNNTSNFDVCRATDNEVGYSSADSTLCLAPFGVI